MQSYTCAGELYKVRRFQQTFEEEKPERGQYDRNMKYEDNTAAIKITQISK